VATVLHIDEIVSDPNIRNGKPIIAGTTLRVSDIATWHISDKQTPEELAVNFRLRMDQVYAALSYYYAHKGEIDEEIRTNAADAEKYLRELQQQGHLITLE
jgi:uncharacterized protein (DUF433 family)